MPSRFALAGLAVVLLCAACAGARGERREVGPSPLPERNRLLFSGEADGYLYTVEPDGSGLRRLTGGRDWGAKSVAWAPDRSRIAFVTVNVRRGSSALVVMRPDGSGQRRLANFSTDQVAVRWRRPGEIEVLRFLPATLGVEVLSVPVQGGRVHRRGNEPAGALSPDGRRLAAARPLENGDTQIHVAAPDGSRGVNVSRVRSVGRGRLADTSPAWSPDGSRIAFLRDRGEGADLHVMGADGGNQLRLIRGTRANSAPAWSPDGRMVAVVGDPDDDGRQDLLVVRATGGRPVVVASSPYIATLAWSSPILTQRRASTARAPVARPFRTARTVSLALDEGAARIVGTRLLLRFASSREQPVFADLAPDARSFAFFRRDELGVYDLSTDSTRLVARLRRAHAGRHAAFSPDGRQLLFRSGAELRVVDLGTGRSRPVAHSRWGPIAWRPDGRIAYRAADRRLTFVRPGGRPRATPYVLRDGRFALSPDGRRLLYDDRCETFLADLASGRRRRLSGHLFVTPDAWAPDGSRFVLQWAESCERDTGSVWAYHTHDVLFDARARRIAKLPGAGATWSRDSRWLLTYPQPTGSSTSGLGGVLGVEVGARRESMLVTVGRAWGDAFVLPGDWLLFPRYDRPGKVSRGVTSGGMYVGRIVGAARR